MQYVDLSHVVANQGWPFCPLSGSTMASKNRREIAFLSVVEREWHVVDLLLPAEDAELFKETLTAEWNAFISKLIDPVITPELVMEFLDDSFLSRVNVWNDLALVRTTTSYGTEFFSIMNINAQA